MSSFWRRAADAVPIKQFRVRGVLERADRLVELGAYRAAIDLLQTENRRLSSAEIEEKLVLLRFEAYFHLDWPKSDSTWPPIQQDRYADVMGIPEIERSDFASENLRSGVFHHGSIIVRQLLSAEHTKLLVESIRSAYAAHDRFEDGGSTESTRPWYVPFSPDRLDELGVTIPRNWTRSSGAELAADSPRGLFNLIRVFEDEGIIDVIGGYLGERPALSVLKTSLREVPHDRGHGGNGWHQDGAFLGQGIRTVNVWIALSDCGVDAPSLEVVPRRLDGIVPTGTEGAAFDWSVSIQQIHEISESSPPVHLEFRAGDAIVFDEMNLHRTSGLPSMTRSRFAIEAWFFAPSAFPLYQLPLVV